MPRRRGLGQGRNVGKPLPPDRQRFFLIPGDSKRRYIDRDTGQVVSRFYAESSIARSAGFRNLREYQEFTSNYGYGMELGGLQGLRGRSVLRAKHLMEDWEDEHGFQRGSIVFRNPSAVYNMRQFLLTPFNQKRIQLAYLAAALDDLGLRKFNLRLLPGES